MLMLLKEVRTTMITKKKHKSYQQKPNKFHLIHDCILCVLITYNNNKRLFSKASTSSDLLLLSGEHCDT